MAVPIPFFRYIGGVVTSILVDRTRPLEVFSDSGKHPIVERAYLKHIPLHRSGYGNIVDQACVLISPQSLSFLTVTLTSGDIRA